MCNTYQPKSTGNSVKDISLSPNTVKLRKSTIPSGSLQNECHLFNFAILPIWNQLQLWACLKTHNIFEWFYKHEQQCFTRNMNILEYAQIARNGMESKIP